MNLEEMIIKITNQVNNRFGALLNRVEIVERKIRALLNRIEVVEGKIVALTTLKTSMNTQLIRNADRIRSLEYKADINEKMVSSLRRSSDLQDDFINTLLDKVNAGEDITILNNERIIKLEHRTEDMGQLVSMVNFHTAGIDNLKMQVDDVFTILENYMAVNLDPARDINIEINILKIWIVDMRNVIYELRGSRGVKADIEYIKVLEDMIQLARDMINLREHQIERSKGRPNVD